MIKSFKGFIIVNDPAFYEKVKGWGLTLQNVSKKDPKYGLIYHIRGFDTPLPDVVRLQELWVDYLQSLHQNFQVLPLLINGTTPRMASITDVYIGPVSE